MLNFQELILRKFLVLFLFLFISVGGIVYYWVKDLYIESVKDSLKQNIEILSYQIDSTSNLDKTASKIKKDLNLRLTVVSKNGNILAESHYDKSTMDNHRYREEIISAKNNEFGFMIRHSSTIDKDLLYMAKKIKPKDSDVIYIRLAQELQSINDQIYILGIKILGALAVFFIAIFITAYKISIQVQSETLKILRFLKALTKNRKETYISSELSEEFYKITKLLSKVAQILMKKEKQKAKYTAKLKASNEQKDDIISAISHEFKNPISVINGYAQTLLEDDELNENIRKKFLTKIQKNGERISELIDTLRLSTKLDSGKQSLQYTNVNLFELCQDISENVSQVYKNREINLLGSENIFIKADENLLSIVITNLIENACKYSEDEVTIKIDEKSISIIDTGIGIKSKDLSKITNKFYRVSSNSWNNSLGLGLFLVNNIIELHNFKLKISSKENEGSTFKIEFLS